MQHGFWVTYSLWNLCLSGHLITKSELRNDGLLCCRFHFMAYRDLRCTCVYVILILVCLWLTISVHSSSHSNPWPQIGHGARKHLFVAAFMINQFVRKCLVAVIACKARWLSRVANLIGLGSHSAMPHLINFLWTNGKHKMTNSNSAYFISYYRITLELVKE